MIDSDNSDSRGSSITNFSQSPSDEGRESPPVNFKNLFQILKIDKSKEFEQEFKSLSNNTPKNQIEKLILINLINNKRKLKVMLKGLSAKTS